MLQTTSRSPEGRLREWMAVAATACVVILVYGLLLWEFPPSLLFLPTITTGGDTLSHYAAAEFLRDHLLPHGKLVGWMPGNFAGFPLFLFYFPLTFLFIAGLSLVTSFQVAFKLGTVAGTFGLPVASLLTLRLMGLPFPAPALGALFSLCFLFIESNSMWGGNIPSTLAGEFAYSFSLPLLVLFLGVLYRGIRGKRHAALCGLLFALVGFSHGYTMVMAAAAGLFFLVFDRDRPATIRYLMKVYSLGGLLIGFWLLPLIVYLPYTSGWPISWQFRSALEPLPIVLWPALGGALATAVYAMRQTDAVGVDREWVRQVHYLTYPLVLGVLLFSVAARLHLVDIRFLSMAQFFTTLVAAAGAGKLWRALPRWSRLPALIVVAALTIPWLAWQQSYTRSWIGANYRGMEWTPLWRQYRILNAILAGGPNDPRVMYEHSVKHEAAGTIRAFEALPLFSGRSTLEGVYHQASPSAPFIFYLQSELSLTPSCPFPQYKCASLDPTRAVPHLELFNVKQFIAISPEVKAALAKNPAFQQQLVLEPYVVYSVLQGDGHYVVTPSYQPVVVTSKEWKRIAYAWFQRPDWLEVPLLFLPSGSPGPGGTAAFRGLDEGPEKVPLPGRCRVAETVRDQEIRFETDCPGRPHLVKVSYHPKWRVEGAEAIYLSSPAFMLVYPTERQVRLVFDNRWPDVVGWAATAGGLLWILVEGLAFPIRRRYSQSATRGPVVVAGAGREKS